MRGKVGIRRGFAILAGLALCLGAVTAARAEVVHFKQLMAILDIKPPQGWEVGEKPHGSTMKSPVEVSEAKVEFKSGLDRRVEVAIIDGAATGIPQLGMAQHVVEMESSEEYLKPIDIQGFKGWETYRFNDKNGDLHLIVGNRFLVSLRGENLENTQVLKTLAGQLDLKKLAELAK